MVLKGNEMLKQAEPKELDLIEWGEILKKGIPLVDPFPLKTLLEKHKCNEFKKAFCENFLSSVNAIPLPENLEI